jgi:hypothetical protein
MALHAEVLQERSANPANVRIVVDDQYSICFRWRIGLRHESAQGEKLFIAEVGVQT